MARIAHILGVTALALAGIVMARCAAELQQSPCDGLNDTISIVEQSKQSARNQATSPNRLSPLVKQAEAFALYLDPPTPVRHTPPVVAPQRPVPVVAAVETRPVNTAPKFELGGISYHRSKPEKSRALLREPGGGYRWVRQGAQWGHVIITEIRSDSIVYEDGSNTHQMAFAPTEVSTAWAQGSPAGRATTQTETPSLSATGRIRPVVAGTPAEATSPRVAAANYREAVAQQNRRRYEQNVRLTVRVP